MRTLRSIVEVMFRTSNDALQQKKLEIAATEGVVLEEKGHDLLAIIRKCGK
jgi:phosphoserine aminotransferase